MPQVCARVLDTPPDSLAPEGLPTALEAVIMKCLEKKADSRFADVGAFALALQPFAPERSEISIERIMKVIGTPPSHNLNVSTGDAFFPRAVSPSAPTLSEDEISISVQRETLPMPAMTPFVPKVGGETMTNATLSANHFLATRKQRMTASYGAAGFLLFALVLVGARNHSRGVASAEGAAQPSAPVVAAASVVPSQAPALEKIATTTIAAPVAPPIESKSPTIQAVSSSSAPQASATSSSRPRKRNQDLSKLFGGRD
jgi:hypothetical protein